MDLGFIGLGKMGKPMVERLLEAGHAVHVFNRSAGAVELLVEKGAIREGSAADVAARAEMVMTALPTTESVEQVFGQMAPAARAGQLFVDHSTVSPDLNRRCAALLAERGAAFLDAPVSGGPAGAAAGTLTVMVGGSEVDLERAEPVFHAFGENVRLCGPTGAGQAVKLVNQLLVAIHTSAIAEAAVFGVSLGADPQVILDLIGTSFGSSMMLRRNVPRFMSRDFSPATPVSLILKDLGLIRDEAQQAGAPFLLGALAMERFVAAVAQGYADDDMAALVRLWEESAGRIVGESAGGSERSMTR